MTFHFFRASDGQLCLACDACVDGEGQDIASGSWEKVMEAVQGFSALERRRPKPEWRLNPCDHAGERLPMLPSVVGRPN